MSIYGLFTTQGIAKSIDADNNEGFYIHPLRFGVSDIAGALDPSRTTANGGEFYQANISSRVVVDANTVKFICTIPQGQTLVTKDVKEIVVYAEDSLNVQFLLAIGQPSENLIYDPTGTITLELQMSLIDIDLTANYLFTSTQATELAEHVTDPNAHPEFTKAMSNAGIFIPAGAYPFDYVGQDFDEEVEFAGTNSTATSGGVTFTSVYNGTEGNSISLVFDGIDTTDEVVLAWNNANPDNLATHNGTGVEVLTAQTVNLISGTYLVDDKDIVYRDTDGLYKKALANGTISTKAVGIARRDKRIVVMRGLFSYTSGLSVGTILYLSSATAGDFSSTNNGVSLGIVLKSDLILFTGFSGSSDINVSETFDAVVSAATGLNFYSTTQAAIAAVTSPARILHDKVEEISTTIDTLGKTVEVVFSNMSKGWVKAPGQSAAFLIGFSSVPTQGTWRIEWAAQETTDLAFNANAAAVQSAFNLLAGHTGVVVTGDYTVGFTVTFADNVPQPLPTFAFAGLNEIQRFNFGNIPDNGTIQFEYEAQPTVNFPWDDSAADLKIALENLSTISTVNVTGSFATGYFQIEFITNWFTDGLKPLNNITAIAKTLKLGVTDTLVNGSNITPINPVNIQQGRYPASNLFTAGNAVITITPSVVTTGAAIGPETCIVLDGDNIHLTGFGFVQNFGVGVDLNGQLNPIVALRFDNTTKPIVSENLVPGQSMDISDTIGFAKDLLAQLRITEHPSSKKRLKISGVEKILASGITLSQQLTSLLMNFSGAEIDFVTGTIYKEDGVTALGLNFTPIIPAATLYRWASINIIPKVLLADDAIQCQVEVQYADADGASKLLAKKPPFTNNGMALGAVVLLGDIGLKEQTRVVTTADSNGSLDGTYHTFYDNVGKVAYWYDLTGSTTEPVHGAYRSKMVSGSFNDNPLTLAIALETAGLTDALFNVTRSGNRVFFESTTIGPRTDSAADTTNFFVTTMVQGRNTDASGLVDITNYDVVQFATGSGGGGNNQIFADFLNPIVTTLPTGVSVVIDGITGVNDDLVLFTNLASNNNKIYKLSGVGVAVAWTAIRAFSSGETPIVGESVRIREGNGFATQEAIFNGTNFKVNDTVRYFSGADYWEQSSLKTSDMLNNTTGNIFSVSVTSSENWTIDYSIVRGANKETGLFLITSDGTSAGYTRYRTVLGDVGVDLFADIDTGNIRFRHTTDNSGGDAVIKYFSKRWSNAAGGPSGLPSYTSSAGSVSAAGSIGEIQFHGAGGLLDADPSLKWDDTSKEIDLNGLKINSLSGGLTLNDNQIAPATIVALNQTNFKFAIFEYSITRASESRIGRILLCHNGTTTSISDDSVDTGGAGIDNTAIVFSSTLSGGNMNLKYTTDSTGNTGTFKYSVRKWV